MKPETIQLLRNLAWGLGLLSVVSLLLWGTWHLVRLPALTIDQVVVTGGETINHADIQVQVEQVLQGEYWGFVPRQFVLTYPRQDILDSVMATPRVKDPIVQRQGKALRVTLAEFEPVALWCAADAATNTPCVFLDENGYGFAQAPLLDGGAFTRFSRVGAIATTSAVYADGDDFLQLRQLERLLRDQGWPVASIEFDQARDAFVYLVSGGELKVTLRLSPEETLDNLQTVLGAEEYSHLRPGNFSYIDLRFGNKVFVNEFGDPTEQLSEVATTTQNAASDDAAADDV